MDLNSLNGALEVLGSYLSDKVLKYEVVAIGGGKTHDVLRNLQDL